MTVGLVGDEAIDAVEIGGIVIFNFQAAWRSGCARDDPNLSPKDPSQFGFGGSDIGIDLSIRFSLSRGSFRAVEVLYAPFRLPN